jgi:hypothetical protein
MYSDEGTMTVRHPHHHGHDEGSDHRRPGPARGGCEPRADHRSAGDHDGHDRDLHDRDLHDRDLHDRDLHDHGLHDHGTAGPGQSIGRPTILSITCAEGERISKIRRADGSTFTVIVPRGGIDRPWATSRPGARWVHEDGAPPRVPDSALARLAARVGLADGPALQLPSPEG